MPSVWARPSGHALPAVVHTRLLAYRLPSDAILPITKALCYQLSNHTNMKCLRWQTA